MTTTMQPPAMQPPDRDPVVSELVLISEFIEEVSPLLPNPGHTQDSDRSMLTPFSLAPRDAPRTYMRG